MHEGSRGCSEDTKKAIKSLPKNIRAGGGCHKYGAHCQASKDIWAGEWVHLHNIRNDERSSHLDVMTGAPKDTRYE